MVISVYVLSMVFIAHFVADFPMQSRTMAVNKSTSWKWLSSHIFYYTVTMMCIGLIITPIYCLFVLDDNYYYMFTYYLMWVVFCIVNGVAHFLTDAVTSRGTSYFYKKGDTHTFFTIIGLDQLVHGVTLILTYAWIIGV